MSHGHRIRHFYLNGALLLCIFLLLAASVWAGSRRGVPRAGLVAGGTVVPTFAYGVQPPRYYYPNGFYYAPYQAPVVVYSPYGPAYSLQPSAIVTLPFFCVLDNRGFVSRVALVDHIAGTHKIPLDTAATICPDGLTSCIFPSY